MALLSPQKGWNNWLKLKGITNTNEIVKRYVKTLTKPPCFRNIFPNRAHMGNPIFRKQQKEFLAFTKWCRDNDIVKSKNQKTRKQGPKDTESKYSERAVAEMKEIQPEAKRVFRKLTRLCSKRQITLSELIEKYTSEKDFEFASGLYGIEGEIIPSILMYQYIMMELIDLEKEADLTAMVKSINI